MSNVLLTDTASAKVPIFPLDFAHTFSLQRLGRHDPTAVMDLDCFSKAFFYRSQPAILEFSREGESIVVHAHGPHAHDLLAETMTCLKQDDRYHSFSTEDSGIHRLHRRHAGLRILRFPWLYDSTCSAILQQRIRTVDAVRDWGRIARRWGTKITVGHLELRCFPPAETLAQVPDFALRSLNIDAQRTKTLLRFARESCFVPLKPAANFSRLRDQLQRIPGIGPWTTETVLGYGAGDSDAAIPGDLHLPHVVCYALAGENPGSDDRMMELLEPFRGHRFRIIRLLYASGISIPRT